MAPVQTLTPKTRIYLIEELQHDGEDVGVGFVNLVEEHHGVGALPQLGGELPAFLVAHVARRGADELGDLEGCNKTHNKLIWRRQEWVAQQAATTLCSNKSSSMFFVISVALQVSQNQLICNHWAKCILVVAEQLSRPEL